MSPTTGTRENPDRTSNESTWRSPVVSFVTTMSVRGTITSRVSVSPSSKTERNISRSSSSIACDSLTRCTMSRSSSSSCSGVLVIAAGRPTLPATALTPASRRDSRSRVRTG